MFLYCGINLPKLMEMLVTLQYFQKLATLLRDQIYRFIDTSLQKCCFKKQCVYIQIVLKIK